MSVHSATDTSFSPEPADVGAATAADAREADSDPVTVAEPLTTAQVVVGAGSVVEPLAFAQETAVPTVGLGDEGPEVTQVQERLAAHGFSPGRVDGDFGPRTAGALGRFQDSQIEKLEARIEGLRSIPAIEHAAGQLRGLRAERAEGVAGPQTRALLDTTPVATPAGSGGTAAGREIHSPVGGDQYNVGYDRNWNDWSATALHNSDFSRSRTDFRHPNHLAVDIFGPLGAPIQSTVAGEIVSVQTTSRGGNNVTIREAGTDNYYYYAHLDAFEPGLSVGQTVAAGQQIGTLGNTGSAISTAPHLHFSQYVGGNGSAFAVDPFDHVMEGRRQDQERAADAAE